MIRSALALAVLLLAGCESRLTGDTVAAAVEVCRPHGGLAMLTATSSGRSVTHYAYAHCANNAVVVTIVAGKAPGIIVGGVR